MKALICEMCGSNDLIKNDGIFVCQSCGVKYSVEEAKKMMVDGVVNVQGSVNINHRNEIANLQKSAHNLFLANNLDGAYKTYMKLANLDPDNIYAELYLALSKRPKNDYYPRDFSNTVVDTCKKVFEKQFNLLGDSYEYFMFCKEVLPDISFTVDYIKDCFKRSTHRGLEDYFRYVFPSIEKIPFYIFEEVNDFSTMDISLLKSIDTFKKSILPENGVYNNEMNELFEVIFEIGAEKYWKTHPEKREYWETKKRENTEKRTALQKDIDNLRKKMCTLQEERSSLSLFELRRKAVIQEEIDKIGAELERTKKQASSIEWSLNRVLTIINYGLTHPFSKLVPEDIRTIISISDNTTLSLNTFLIISDNEVLFKRSNSTFKINGFSYHGIIFRKEENGKFSCTYLPLVTY